MKYKIFHSKISCVDDRGKELAKVTFPETSSNSYDIRHTVVDESLRGQGIAGKLVELAILEINRRGGALTASCSYAQKWIEKHGIRPYVTCHMVTSLDGKVTGSFLNSEIGLQSAEDYYEINRQLKGDAFVCGRVTMESSFTGSFKPDLSTFANADISTEDYVAQQHPYYAVSFDRYGGVGWKENFIHDADEGYDNCHIIEVLTEDTPTEMLAYYRSIGVSYLFAGEHDIDIYTALCKLYSLFGIKRLMLEGGSIINGAFLKADTVDELSLVVAPTSADADDEPLFFGCDSHTFTGHMRKFWTAAQCGCGTLIKNGSHNRIP